MYSTRSSKPKSFSQSSSSKQCEDDDSLIFEGAYGCNGYAPGYENKDNDKAIPYECSSNRITGSRNTPQGGSYYKDSGRHHTNTGIYGSAVSSMKEKVRRGPENINKSNSETHHHCTSNIQGTVVSANRHELEDAIVPVSLSKVKKNSKSQMTATELDFQKSEFYVKPLPNRRLLV